MKKISLVLLVCLFTFGVTNAGNSKIENEKDNEGIVVYNVSSFCKLIQKGNIEVVKYLIASGEDVNQKSKGLTPLMFAARHNKAEIAKLLINSGAKLNVKSKREMMTALQLAKRFKAVDVIKVLEAVDDK